VSRSALGAARVENGRTAPAVPPVGGPAPAFSLTDQHGVQSTLHGLLDKRAALVVFYPFAFSAICGGELQELRGARPEFEGREVRLVAISCDPMYALRVYADQEDLGFPLLSDFWPHGATARSYGVFDEDRGCAGRASFLVDGGGVVRWSVVNPLHEPRPVKAYLEALALLDD
jgi:peroxiredoxin